MTDNTLHITIKCKWHFKIVHTFFRFLCFFGYDKGRASDIIGKHCIEYLIPEEANNNVDI